MIRFIIFLLLLFIVYNVIRFFLKALGGSGKTYERVHHKEKKSKYEDVEEAKFKEIDDGSEKKDKP